MPGPDTADEFAGFTPVVPVSESFDALYGLELVDRDGTDAGAVRGWVAVTPQLLTRDGVLHSGVMAAIAESLASRGTAREALRAGVMPRGLANDTTTLATITDGAVHAEARPLSRSPDTWVWTVEMRDDAGTLCGVSRVIIAVRAMTPPGEAGSAA
jgi:1,4-dihydroxy-2-naphthoyl-CoA hydrolase